MTNRKTPEMMKWVALFDEVHEIRKKRWTEHQEGSVLRRCNCEHHEERGDATWRCPIHGQSEWWYSPD